MKKPRVYRHPIIGRKLDDIYFGLTEKIKARSISKKMNRLGELNVKEVFLGLSDEEAVEVLALRKELKFWIYDGGADKLYSFISRLWKKNQS